MNNDVYMLSFFLWRWLDYRRPKFGGLIRLTQQSRWEHPAQKSSLSGQSSIRENCIFH